jgi:hypothetical protein
MRKEHLPKKILRKLSRYIYRGYIRNILIETYSNSFFLYSQAYHSVGIHGVDDVGLFLGSLSALCGLQEEGILKKATFLT